MVINMSGIKTFNIKLDRPLATFTPGTEITGEVVLDLSKTKKFQALKLRFKGRCRVHFRDNSGSRKDARFYTEKEHYFRTDLCLHGNTTSDSVELAEGYHVFPFSFLLPENIPCSFEHKMGFVRYSIKAIMDRPWKFDHETKILFTVETPFQLDSLPLRQRAIDDDVEDSYCCMLIPCITQGSMSLRIQIPQTWYACGDAVEAKINIDNKSDSVDVSRVKLAIQQKITFHSRTPPKTKHIRGIVQKSKKMGPFLKKSEVNLGLQVPSVAYSHLQHCSLIHIEYKLLVSVHVTGFHCSKNKAYDILIGSKPTQPQPGAIPFSGDVPANTPSAPITYPTSSLLNEPPPVPYQMPFPSTFPGFVNPTNPSMPYPSQPIPGNYPPYPPQPGLGFENQAVGAYPPPPNVGFMYPNPSAPENRISEPLPPSYESVMAQDARK